MATNHDRRPRSPTVLKDEPAELPLNPRRDTVRLLHLLAVAQHGSLKRAAAELGLTQPALTKSIQALELALGAPVIERGPWGATPTELGEAMIVRARAIEAEWLAARQDAMALRNRARGHLVIGCGPSEATRLLPMALAMLRTQHAAPRVTVHYGLNEALMPMVKSGEIELALSSIPRTAHDPQLQHEPLLNDAAAVIARSEHPLAARRSVLPADLAQASWVLARRRELERRALDELFLNAGLRPVEAEIETTSAVLMKTMVMTSDFLTFLPRELVYWEEKSGLLCALPVAAPAWNRSVGITRRRKARSDHGAQMLVKAIREAAQSLPAQR
jgi:DNA-binding transcriptional LysR family regulator